MLNSLVDLKIHNIEIKNSDYYLDTTLDKRVFLYSEKEIFVIVNSEIYKLDKGKILFVDKNQKCLIESNCNEYYIVSCGGAIIHEMFDFGNVSNKIQYINIKNKRADEKILELILTFKKTLKIDLNIIGLFYQVLYFLNDIAKGKNNNYSFYVVDAIEYIESNYNKDISIIDVASYCGVHPNYLSKLFKEEVGKQLGLDYEPFGTQVRLPFIKGYSVYVPFRKILKEMR